MMQILHSNEVVNKDSGAHVVEMDTGHCVVIQCHHDVGRTFIQSLKGEGASSGCRVSYQGQLVSLASRKLVRQVGFCSLDDGLYERLKLKEYLSFWAELYGVEAPVAHLLRGIGLAEKANERISKLTYSEKRLLSFTRSILHDPELIIWEDPEQKLDLESCMMVRRMIADLIRQNKAVLVTCSTMEQALSISNRIFRLSGSSLTPITVQEPTEVFEPIVDADYEVEAETDSSELEPYSMKLSKLMVKTQDKYVFLDPHDIHYIESNDGITQIYIEEGSLGCAWTLAELEDKLKPFRFYRCHRSYIVNLELISELIVWSRNSYSLVLSDGKSSRIPLSKGKFEELKMMVGL